MTQSDQISLIHAIALVESDDHTEAWGDGGNACGRWQVHTEFLQDYLAADGLVHLTGSWDQVFFRAVDWFITRQAARGDDPLTIAMKFHLGRKAVEEEKKWDAKYGARFNVAWAWVKGDESSKLPP